MNKCLEAVAHAANDDNITINLALESLAPSLFKTGKDVKWQWVKPSGAAQCPLYVTHSGRCELLSWCNEWEFRVMLDGEVIGIYLFSEIPNELQMTFPSKGVLANLQIRGLL